MLFKMAFQALMANGRNRAAELTVKQDLILQNEPPQTVSFLAKGLPDENRLRILLCVSNGKKSVSSIVEELNLSQPWHPEERVSHAGQ